jgi:hypothetical protein
MQDRDELILACRLYEKRSKSNNVYLTGRLGSMKVLIFKSREIADNDEPIWEMKFAASPQQAKKDRPAPSTSFYHDGDCDGPARPATFADDEVPF